MTDPKPSAWPDPAGFTEAERYALEERAAILEFDAGQTREVAERLAFAAWADSATRARS